jgi:hypothetical protein
VVGIGGVENPSDHEWIHRRDTDTVAVVVWDDAIRGEWFADIVVKRVLRSVEADYREFWVTFTRCERRVMIQIVLR